MQEQYYRAPSKINVFLAVNGRDSMRALHRLTGFFLPLDLCDELSIAHCDNAKGNDGRNTSMGAAVKKWSYRISVDGDEAPLISNQILDKVFQLGSENYSLTGHYDVRLRKKIPLKSGLGGGSSDAAALWRFLDDQQQVPLHAHDLMALALRCGSDVPFFLNPKPSIVRNFGEKIEPLDVFAGHAVGPSWLLFKPPCGISTADAYGCIARRASEFYLSEMEAEERLEESLQSFTEKAPGHWLFYNSFQKLFVEMFPGIVPLLRALRDGHYACGMSGSGSAWFIPLEREDDGRDAMRQIRNHLGSAVWMSKVSGWSSM